jgi:predicted RNase H-like HicB family nuclease
MKFLIAIEPGDEQHAFGVVVPDLPGCFSAGDTLAEALANAREAIELHVSTLLEDELRLPAPQAPGVHQAHPDYLGWTWDVVDVPVEHDLARSPFEV